MVEQLFCKQQVVSPNLTSGSMMKKRILVLTDDMPWGHRAIAKAIYGYLKKDEKSTDKYVVDYAEAKISFSAMKDLYVFLYRYLPMSNKLSNVMMENEVLRDLFLEQTDRNIEMLKKTINKYKPDLIISAYFFHSHSLARWREKENLKYKLWTVVADPRTVNAIQFVKGADLHLVYDEVCEKLAINNGIEKSKILKTGWWTRGEMFENKFKVESRKKLGVEDDRPVVFVGGGSLGTNSLIKLLPILMMIKKKCLIIFNTGTDKLAYSMVNEYLKLFEKLKKNDLVKIKCLGWIENMGEMLIASDIVFGKAGPNFLFDVVASCRPFVSISHIGGQEDGNIELIKEKKLGWVKEGVGQSESFLLKYLENPQKYNDKYKTEIAIEAGKNKKCPAVILDRLHQDLF